MIFQCFCLKSTAKSNFIHESREIPSIFYHINNTLACFLPSLTTIRPQTVLKEEGSDFDFETPREDSQQTNEARNALRDQLQKRSTMGGMTSIEDNTGILSARSEDSAAASTPRQEPPEKPLSPPLSARRIGTARPGARRPVVTNTGLIKREPLKLFKRRESLSNMSKCGFDEKSEKFYVAKKITIRIYKRNKRFYPETIMNKTGTSKVSAISKAQKAQI